MFNPNTKYYNAANSEDAVKNNYRMLLETPEYVDFSLARDYVSARSRFQKGYTSLSGEPGYFYFKILLDHRSSPLLAQPDSDPKHSRISAARFLINNRHRAQCTARLQALRKFQKLLYYIEKETPWVFRKVSDINKGLYTDLKKPAEGDRSFNIECSEEFTDFRLSLLLDLYRFACYDYDNQRVIMPENLRMFNMTILFFTIPLRWVHTPISPQLSAIGNAVGTITGNTTKPLPYKGIRQNDTAMPLSAYMIHFRDCEFTDKSMVSFFGAGDNTQPQQFLHKFQIRYRRAYTESVSEWFNINISELNQYYFDSDSATFDASTVNGISQDVNTSKVQQSLLSAIKNELASVKDTFNNISGFFKGQNTADEAERWKLIREQKLWGGQTLGNKLASMVENSIDNIIGGLGDFITLGNIYDESWIANLKGFASADSALSAAESLVKAGMGAAARATGNGFFASVAQNGIMGGISDAVNTASRSAASFLTGRGMSGDFYSMFAKWQLEHNRALNSEQYTIPSLQYAQSAAGTVLAGIVSNYDNVPSLLSARSAAGTVITGFDFDFNSIPSVVYARSAAGTAITPYSEDVAAVNSHTLNIIRQRPNIYKSTTAIPYKNIFYL